MKRLLICLGLLLGVYAQAHGTTFTWTSDSAAQFPVTIGSGYSDDTIMVSGNLSGSTTLFYVNAPRVTIRGNGGDTLWYGTGGGSSNYAISGSSAADTLLIRDLVIIHDPDNDQVWENDPDSDSDGTYITARNNHAILIPAHTTSIINCDLTVYGDNVHALYQTTVGIRNVTIDSCHFWNFSWGYDSRVQYTGAAVSLEIRAASSTWDANPSEFSAHIYRSVVEISPHAGFAVYSGGASDQVIQGMEIAYCTTYVDHRNWSGFSYQSTSANAYGILTSYAEPPFDIHHNFISQGSAHGGSRGIMIENALGTASDSMKIHDNVIFTCNGPDEENPGGVNRAIRMRGLDGHAIDYVYIYDNDITTCADTAEATTHIGLAGKAIDITVDSDDQGYAHLWIERNTFTARALSNHTSISLAAAQYGVDASYSGVAPITIQYNKYVSSDVVVQLTGVDNDYQTHDLYLFADTLSFLPAGDSGYNISDQVTYNVGDLAAGSANSNKAINMYYDTTTGVRDTNIYLGSNGPHDLTLVQRINISAVGTDDSLVANAKFKVWDGNGTVVLNTGAVAAGDTLFDFRYWKTYGTYAGSDSNMNEFDVWVFVTGDTVKLTDTTINWQVTCLPVHLASTSGTLDATDTCEAVPDVCVSITQNTPLNNATVEASQVNIDIDLTDTDGDTLDVVLIGERGDANPTDTLADTTLIADDDWVWNWGSLTEDSTYYWKAIAVDTAGCADTSAIWHFHVDSIPAVTASTSTTLQGVTLQGVKIGQ